jgi:hypothetical protein
MMTDDYISDDRKAIGCTIAAAATTSGEQSVDLTSVFDQCV